jgi:hypothetical protein
VVGRAKVCGRHGDCGKECERVERYDEEPGKVCEEKKVGSECGQDENDGVNKRKRKSEESEWKLGESKIARVSEFNYLGCTFNERATNKAHVREVVAKSYSKKVWEPLNLMKKIGQKTS